MCKQKQEWEIEVVVLLPFSGCTERQVVRASVCQYQTLGTVSAGLNTSHMESYSKRGAAPSLYSPHQTDSRQVSVTDR